MSYDVAPTAFYRASALAQLVIQMRSLSQVFVYILACVCRTLRPYQNDISSGVVG